MGLLHNPGTTETTENVPNPVIIEEYEDKHT